jgi:hypothetical protein
MEVGPGGLFGCGVAAVRRLDGVEPGRLDGDSVAGPRRRRFGGAVTFATLGWDDCNGYAGVPR